MQLELLSKSIQNHQEILQRRYIHLSLLLFKSQMALLNKDCLFIEECYYLVIVVTLLLIIFALVLLAQVGS